MMTDKIDTSPDAVKRFTSPNGYLVPEGEYNEGFGSWVRYDDYAALSARVAELEAGLTATIKRENDANARTMKHLRRAEKLEICSKNYAEFSHEWRARAEDAEQRIAELEAERDTYESAWLEAEGKLSDAEQRAATLEAKLAKADAWQEAVFAAHPNVDLFSHEWRARAEDAEQRIAELEAERDTYESAWLEAEGKLSDAEQRAATLEAKLAKADAWQEAVFAAHPNVDLDIETKDTGR